MNWKIKAHIQNAVAVLPPDLSYKTYEFLQRKFGNLNVTNPTSRLKAGIRMADYIREQDRPLEARSFLEVGTGRLVNCPIALWLCGAGRIVTVDLNPYLAPDLVRMDLGYMQTNKAAIEALFTDYVEEKVFQTRFQQLMELDLQCDITPLLKTMQIEYLAPADATHLGLAEHSIDYHVSYTVMEHIPPDILRGIFLESKRILAPDGLLVHCIDFSDHFSHSDSSISPIHFLQFTEAQWKRLAGNRYMYHNRLRVDEFLAIVAEAGLTILRSVPQIDPRSLEELAGDFSLSERFRSKPPETIATINTWLVATPAEAPL